MPYISPEKREEIDFVVKDNGPKLKSRRHVSFYEPEEPGELNYVITRLIDNYCIDRYINFNAIVGVLECVKQEFYRRKVAPLEDQKKYDHGDVYE